MGQKLAHEAFVFFPPPAEGADRGVRRWRRRRRGRHSRRQTPPHREQELLLRLQEKRSGEASSWAVLTKRLGVLSRKSSLLNHAKILSHFQQTRRRRWRRPK